MLIEMGYINAEYLAEFRELETRKSELELQGPTPGASEAQLQIHQSKIDGFVTLISLHESNVKIWQSLNPDCDIDHATGQITITIPDGE